MRTSDRMCYPESEAPAVTNLLAKCQVCGAEWQIQSPNRDDARGCSFCNAPARAIIITSEAPDYGGADIHGL